MEYLLYFVFFLWVGFEATFVFYIAIINAIAVRDNLTKSAWLFLAPLVIVGVLLDIVVMNFIIGTIIFTELPKEWMFTKRLERYKTKMLDTRRGKMACWFCDILNIFDPKKKHC